MRCEAKHQYFKRLVSQMNWVGNVHRTMAKRHCRYSALQFFVAKLRSASSSAVVVLGSTIHCLLDCKARSGPMSLLFELPALVDRVGSYLGDVVVIQHTKWRYCNQLIQHGTTILFTSNDGQVHVALVERLFEVTGLYLITYRRFLSELLIDNHNKYLPNGSVSNEELVMELNTNQLTIVHRSLLYGKWYVFNT